jgi:hypothetical protein
MKHKSTAQRRRIQPPPHRIRCITGERDRPRHIPARHKRPRCDGSVKPGFREQLLRITFRQPLIGGEMTGGKPEPLGETIPPKRTVYRQHNEAATRTQHTLDLAKDTPRAQHMLNDTGAHHHIGGRVGESGAGFRIVYVKRQVGGCRPPARRRDHLRRKVHPDAALDIARYDCQMVPVSASYVDNGIALGPLAEPFKHGHSVL